MIKNIFRKTSEKKNGRFVWVDAFGKKCYYSKKIDKMIYFN